ncbi:MAG: hypothetical protein Q4E13_07020 [Clostridia bacterium]|nr:hypothetical protein [Clostridia bacterium]
MGLMAYAMLLGLALGALAAWRVERRFGGALRPWQRCALGVGWILLMPLALCFLVFWMIPC